MASAERPRAAQARARAVRTSASRRPFLHPLLRASASFFEQTLALANAEAMLRPGGFLLSNNALLELAVSSMRSVAYKAVPYSDRPHDGDRII